MTYSTIFINEPTVVDHSYITNSGRIVGGSINPSFLVAGRVTEDENVVLDFSKAKKRIKDLIDDPFGGFDHKCWIVQGFSNVVSIFDVDTKESVADWSYLESVEDPSRMLAVTTATMQIRAPKSAFRFVAFSASSTATDFDGRITEAMTTWLEQNMPGFQLTVKMREHAIPVDPSKRVHMFRYVHGLKHSSSWGCQNIAHGHLSFIDVDIAQSVRDDAFVQGILASIARELDNTVFISAENYERDEYFINIGYESTSRGRFEMLLNKAAQQKYVVLETETTIEHIIEYVAARFKTQLKSINATHLYVSEGLSKGAQLQLEHD